MNLQHPPLPDPVAPRVVVAEDSPLLRELFVDALRESGIDVVAGAGDGPGLMDAVARHRPDVAVIDIRMPPLGETQGLRSAVELRAADPRLGVLLLSSQLQTRDLFTLMGKGGRGVGYLLKDKVAGVEALAEAVHRIHRGEYIVDADVVAGMMRRGGGERLPHLTQREKEILALMAEGLSNRAIAARAKVMPRTVEAHIGHLLSTLGLPPAPDYHRRVQAVLAYLRGEIG
ncbi:response regulator transcription factor [Streptosporangium sp. NPDC002524]|uniref:response regulator transcription factor n=1 Tax=Streptosporangium sp. NPDC002524 TaxID=3154537 RepID=UPI00331F1700